MIRDTLKIIDAISGHKRTVLSAPLSDFPFSAEEYQKMTFETFSVHLYTWYTEACKADFEYLRTIACKKEHKVLEEFRTIVVDQRHLFGHYEYSQKDRALSWREGILKNSFYEQDESLKRAMLASMHSALQILNNIAHRASTDESLKATWRLQSETDINSLYKSAQDSLGIHFDYAFDRLIRNFNSHPDRSKLKTEEEFRMLVFRSLLTQIVDRSTLVPYEQLIDEFGATGDSAAAPTICLLCVALLNLGIPQEHLLSSLQKLWPSVSDLYLPD